MSLCWWPVWDRLLALHRHAKRHWSDIEPSMCPSLYRLHVFHIQKNKKFNLLRHVTVASSLIAPRKRDNEKIKQKNFQWHRWINQKYLPIFVWFWFRLFSDVNCSRQARHTLHWKHFNYISRGHSAEKLFIISKNSFAFCLLFWRNFDHWNCATNECERIPDDAAPLIDRIEHQRINEFFPS